MISYFFQQQKKKTKTKGKSSFGMQFQMSISLRRIAKSALAQMALIWLHAGMHPQVCLQSSRPRESLRAQMTRIRSLVGMRSNVLLQIKLHHERLIAKFAHEGPHVQMPPRMHSPLRLIRKRLIAMLTCIRTFAGVMRSCMSQSSSHRFVSFLTERAFIRPIAGMRSLMVLQVRQPRKNLAALIAIVFAIAAVRDRVQSQIVRRGEDFVAFAAWIRLRVGVASTNVRQVSAGTRKDSSANAALVQLLIGLFFLLFAVTAQVGETTKAVPTINAFEGVRSIVCDFVAD